jgi:glucose dehydrogenase
MRTTFSTSIMTCVALAALPARAADTTYERLSSPEPQNWLMHHHDYSAQRYSTLDTINRGNIRNMRLLFAVALGGASKDDSLEATPERSSPTTIRPSTSCGASMSAPASMRRR